MDDDNNKNNNKPSSSSGSSSKAQQVVKAGGVQAILSYMNHNNHGDNYANSNNDAVITIEKSLLILKNLARDNDNQELIAAAGGIATIFHVILAHAHEAKVQAYGFRALTYLANNEANQVAIASSSTSDENDNDNNGNGNGGIATILNVMKMYVRDARVQADACGLLWNLAKNEHNQRIICSKGGIPAIAKAMRSHEHDARAHSNGCFWTPGPASAFIPARARTMRTAANMRRST